LEKNITSLKYFLIRKVIHFFFGLISILLFYQYPSLARYFFVSAAISFIVFDLWRRTKGKWRKLFYDTFGKMLKETESKGRITGATTFLMTIAGLSFSFPQNIVVIAILILSISDPLASIAGKLYPVKRIRNGKSLVGSTAFFLSTLVIYFIAAPISAIPLIFASILVTLIELYAPEIVENILIGFGAAIILVLL
jgi:dolichol kinase